MVINPRARYHDTRFSAGSCNRPCERLRVCSFSRRLIILYPELLKGIVLVLRHMRDGHIGALLRSIRSCPIDSLRFLPSHHHSALHSPPQKNALSPKAPPAAWPNALSPVSASKAPGAALAKAPCEGVAPNAVPPPNHPAPRAPAGWPPLGAVPDPKPGSTATSAQNQVTCSSRHRLGQRIHARKSSARSHTKMSSHLLRARQILRACQRRLRLRRRPHSEHPTHHKRQGRKKLQSKGRPHRPKPAPEPAPELLAPNPPLNPACGHRRGVNTTRSRAAGTVQRKARRNQKDKQS